MELSTADDDDAAAAAAATREEDGLQWNKHAAIFGASMLPIMMSPEVTNAAGPDWGLFEGKTGSLLHPIMMFAMATYTLSTALVSVCVCVCLFD